MRPAMQLSFLFDCDDVALPALKLDPDTELARVLLVIAATLALAWWLVGAWLH
jgi:hypothetical protein